MFRIGYTLGIVVVTLAMTAWAPLRAVFEVWHGGLMLVSDVWR